MGAAGVASPGESLEELVFPGRIREYHVVLEGVGDAQSFLHTVEEPGANDRLICPR